KTASLYANPRLLLNPDEAVERLAGVLPDLDRAEAHARLTSDRSFVWIYRHLTPRQQYEVNRLGIPGLDFQTEERRVYPAGALAAHLLGHTDIDSRGLMGVEHHFDSELRRRQEPLPLALDLRAQHALRTELKKSMDQFGAIGAAGIVMDVRNGEVVAMVSLPEFDPNHPESIEGEARFNRATL